MTPNDEKLVLNWLRERAGHPDRKVERRILQRALRSGEPISREIRDAMADWLQDGGAGLILNEEAFEEACSMALEDAAGVGTGFVKVTHVPFEDVVEVKPAPASQADPLLKELDDWCANAGLFGQADPTPAPASPAGPQSQRTHRN